MASCSVETSNRLVVATANAGKLEEIRRLFAGTAIEVTPQSELGVVAAEETGSSFCENALIKARHAATQTGHPAVADDSGLEVDALNGAPGIRSARFAGEYASDSDNIEKLLAALSGVPREQRGARFVCVMAYVDAGDADPVICTGTWSGQIAASPSGEGGFGYDPVFFIPELNCTAAELDAETKNRLSHRGQALRALLETLQSTDAPGR